MADTFCYPWWHYQYGDMRGTGLDVSLASSGCVPNANGDILCPPETMRARAEAQLKASGHWAKDKKLTLGTYTLARYMHGEVGSGTVEERVAVGEAAVNQARTGYKGLPPEKGVVNLLLYRTAGKSSYGYYGRINLERDGVTVNTGRWAQTSVEPSVLTAILADLVMTDSSGDFAQGANDQDGLEYKRYFPVPMDRIMKYAARGSYWVGPLVGIDHWHTTLFKPYGVKPDSLIGRGLIERARAYFGNPRWDERGRIEASMRPVWPSTLPPCSMIGDEPSTTTQKVLVGAAIVGGALALVGGAVWFSKQIGFAPMSHGKGKTPKRLSGRLRDDSDDEWDVAADALHEALHVSGKKRERYLQRAAHIYRDIQAVHGFTTPSDAYDAALKALPYEDQFKIAALMDD